VCGPKALIGSIDAIGIWYNIASMRVRLYSNGVEAPVSPFVGKFAGNVCSAVAASLKGPRAGKQIHFELEGDAVRLKIDGIEIPMDKSQGFAEILARDTLRGMIQHLKGIEGDALIRLEVDIAAQS